MTLYTESGTGGSVFFDQNSNVIFCHDFIQGKDFFQPVLWRIITFSVGSMAGHDFSMAEKWIRLTLYPVKYGAVSDNNYRLFIIIIYNFTENLFFFIPSHMRPQMNTHFVFWKFPSKAPKLECEMKYSVGEWNQACVYLRNIYSKTWIFKKLAHEFSYLYFYETETYWEIQGKWMKLRKDSYTLLRSVRFSSY